jgi:hypothetical protein
MTTPPIEELQRVALEVCTPKELDALAVLVNPTFTNDHQRARACGLMTDRGYRYRLASATRKIVAAYTTEQEMAA